MRNKIYIFIFLFLNVIIFSISKTFAQSNVSGNWEGTISVEQEGKVLANYKLVLQITQDSSHLEGRSWIWYKDLKAVFSLKGIIKDNNLEINELEIVEADKLPSGEWCSKMMKLLFIPHRKTDKLEGKWEGKTSFSQCLPGKIMLKKITDRV